jgi:catechol 2,3-dioxygenase-like lactoylglutathione lyase family enzyme
VIVIPARLSIVTLGVEDLPRVRSFYEGLGWTSHSDLLGKGGDHGIWWSSPQPTLVENSTKSHDHRPFPTRPQKATSSLAEETGLPLAAGGFKGVTLEVNVHPREQVAAATDEVRKVGGTVSAEPADRPWGGRSGDFTDPEATPGEVAWMPGATFDSRGALIWPE